jgi:hypothetical protein
MAKRLKERRYEGKKEREKIEGTRVRESVKKGV